MSKSIRHMGQLLTANIAAQAVGLAAYALLTRMYAPEDFGLLNLWLSIGGIAALLATAEYPTAVLLPLREEEAAGVARVALRVVVLVMALMALTLPWSTGIASLLGAPGLSRYYWLLIPYVGALGCWTVYNAWLTRSQSFGAVSGYQLNQSLTGVLTKVLFGWAGWLRSGLVVSSLISPLWALGAAVACTRTRWKALWQSEPEGWRVLAKRYYRFPLYSMPRSLVNNLSSNLPALLLTPCFGLTQMGFFAMAMTLAMRPITMVTASIHQVLFERVAAAVREGRQVLPWLGKRWLQMAALVVAGMTTLWWAMPWLVRLFLGAGWDETASLIRYMLPWLSMVLLVAPLAFVSEVFGRQRLFLVLEVVYLGLRIGAMCIGIWRDSLSVAIIGMTIAGTLMLVVQLGVYGVLLRRHDRSCLTQTGE